MAADNDIIDKLRSEAIRRCRERILKVPKDRDDYDKRPEYRPAKCGVTTGLKARYGL
jgi:hypothetical protein